MFRYVEHSPPYFWDLAQFFPKGLFDGTLPELSQAGIRVFVLSMYDSMIFFVVLGVYYPWNLELLVAIRA